jgi:hypothetical protein
MYSARIGRELPLPMKQIWWCSAATDFAVFASACESEFVLQFASAC